MVTRGILVCVLSLLGLLACGPSVTTFERKLLEVQNDSKRQGSTFASHFSSEISPARVEAIRSALRKEGKPKFEHASGPRCVRMYWGNYTIHKSYFVYFAKKDGHLVIDRIDTGSNFAQSFGSIGLHNSGRAETETPHDRCKSVNGL